MHIKDFNYDLPESYIAKFPVTPRRAARLLHCNRASGHLQHHRCEDLPSLLRPGDLLVFNNTRVIPARLYGRKVTGGKIECLIERILDNQHALAHIKASKSPQVGMQLEFSDDFSVTVNGRAADLFEIAWAGEGTLLEKIEQYGQMPLPPYINRPASEADLERYQTVYAKHQGAVAAPTAGLHFDDVLLAACKTAGIELAEVTLHVGAGTFQPVRVENILDHKMHCEWCTLRPETVAKIQQTRKNGGRVIAVGTTTVRTLESAVTNGQLEAITGDTDIFIYPGFEFKVIDGMITNFHLPESTLLMLVAAFIGRETMLVAYQTAIEENYRFYSYGDAMLLL